MPLVKVQTTGFFHGNSVLAGSFPATVGVGNSVVVMVAAAATVTPTVTDDKANVYTLDSSSQVSGGGAGFSWIFRSSGIANSPKTISITGGTVMGAVAIEVSGSLTLDQVNSLNGAASVPNAGNITTTVANEYVAAIYASGYVQVAPGPPAGFTTEASDATGATWMGVAADELLVAVAAVSTLFTGGIVGFWNACVASYYGAAAPPTAKGASFSGEHEGMRDYTACKSRIRIVKNTTPSTWISLCQSNQRRVAIAIFAVTADNISIANDTSVAYSDAGPGINPCGYPVWFYRDRHGSVVTDPWYAGSKDATAFGVIEVIE
jgi:hypothetical protein